MRSDSPPPGPEAAHTSHREIDPDTCLRRGVESVDDLRVREPVHLDGDAARLAYGRLLGYLAEDQGLMAWGATTMRRWATGRPYPVRWLNRSVRSSPIADRR